MARRLTVEQVLWAGVLLFAGTLRFWDLGGLPLQSPEAAKALASWQMVQGQGGVAEAGPLLRYGNALVFLVFGANDASARLVPALAGTALVGLPYLLRAPLGRWGALVAAALLALSPTMVYFSRLVSDQSIVAAAALGVVASLAGLDAGASRRRLYGVAIALALLVLAGRDAYTMLIVLAGAALLARHAAPRFEAAELRRAALLGGAVVVLGATALLLNWHGIQEGLVTPLERWLGALRGDGQPWHFQVQILLVYEAVSLVFAILGAVWALREGGWPRLFVWWAAVALVVSSLSGERPGGGLALAVVPLALLGGPAAMRVVRAVWGAVPRQELAVFLGTMLSLLVLIWIGTQFFTLSGQAPPAMVPIGPLTLSVRWLGDVALRAQIVILLACLLALGLWIGMARLPGLSALLALVVLGAFAFRSTVLLNFASYASAAELPVAVRTAPHARVLARDLGDAVDALAAYNRPRAVRAIAPEDEGDHTGSLLRWYLRELPGVSFGARATGEEALLVTGAGGEPPPGRYAAQRYRLAAAWDGGAWDGGRFWRWLTLREAPGPAGYADLVLYVRTR